MEITIHLVQVTYNQVQPLQINYLASNHRGKLLVPSIICFTSHRLPDHDYTHIYNFYVQYATSPQHYSYAPLLTATLHKLETLLYNYRGANGF